MLATSVFRLKPLQKDKAHFKKGIADFGKIVNFTALWHSHSLSIYLWLLGSREPLESYKRRRGDGKGCLRWRDQRGRKIRWMRQKKGGKGVEQKSQSNNQTNRASSNRGCSSAILYTTLKQSLSTAKTSDTNKHLNWSETK